MLSLNFPFNPTENWCLLLKISQSSNTDRWWLVSSSHLASDQVSSPFNKICFIFWFILFCIQPWCSQEDRNSGDGTGLYCYQGDNAPEIPQSYRYEPRHCASQTGQTGCAKQVSWSFLYSLSFLRAAKLITKKSPNWFCKSWETCSTTWK